jgi:hypothetical protein
VAFGWFQSTRMIRSSASVRVSDFFRAISGATTNSLVIDRAKLPRSEKLSTNNLVIYDEE